MIRYGIVGTGNISRQFADALAHTRQSELAAVCSRSQHTADDFAGKYGVKHSFSNFEAFMACDDIDIVYVGTPNNCHLEHVKLLLENKKNVLCEKPLGVNAHETQEMITLAQQKDVFLMEGMWTRFFPAVKKAIEWIRSGVIGDLRMIIVNMGINLDRSNWRFRADMAGGAILDLGVYALAITFLILGRDYTAIYGAANTSAGVDIADTATLVYPDNTLAILNFGMESVLRNGVYVHGTKGQVLLGGDIWWSGQYSELTLTEGGRESHEGPTTRFEEPYPSTGLQYEADHVAECIKNGLKQSPIMPHEESIHLAKTMDKLRHIYGIAFAQDAEYAFPAKRSFIE